MKNIIGDTMSSKKRLKKETDWTLVFVYTVGITGILYVVIRSIISLTFGI
jgi:hypothetical protein